MERIQAQALFLLHCNSSATSGDHGVLIGLPCKVSPFKAASKLPT